jgi:hypothetical protein
MRFIPAGATSAGLHSLNLVSGPPDRILVDHSENFAAMFDHDEGVIDFLDADAKQGPTVLFYDFHSRHATPVSLRRKIPSRGPYISPRPAMD